MQEEIKQPEEPKGFRNLLRDVNTCGNCTHCVDTGSWEGEDWHCTLGASMDGIDDFKEDCKQIYEGVERILNTEKFVDIKLALPYANSNCVCDLWEAKK